MQTICMDGQLPVNSFNWLADSSQFKKDFIKNCDGNSDIGYFFEVDVEYLKKLFSGAALNHHKDLQFLPKRKKIKKCEKLVCNIKDKEKYLTHIRA